jgi:hypothetical protein
MVWRIDSKFHILFNYQRLLPKDLCDSSYQWDYNFTIGVSLEVVGVLETFANESVVIDFTIDCKGNSFIFVGEWLRATVNSNDTQTLVCENCEC